MLENKKVRDGAVEICFPYKPLNFRYLFEKIILKIYVIPQGDIFGVNVFLVLMFKNSQ